MQPYGDTALLLATGCTGLASLTCLSRTRDLQQRHYLGAHKKETLGPSPDPLTLNLQVPRCQVALGTGVRAVPAPGPWF